MRPVAGGTAPAVTLGMDDSWAVGAAGIHVLRARTTTAPAIWLYPWSGPARRLVELPYTWGRISVGADGSIVFGRDIDDQIDLGIVELKS